MRDIRIDLRERLAILDGRYVDAMVSYDLSREILDREHFATLEIIKRERCAIEQMIAIENERNEAVALPTDRRLVAPLMDFLVARLAAYGPADKDQLRSAAEAAGYFSGEVTGRTLHTTLMNMVRSGKVSRHIDGRYASPELGSKLFRTDQEGEMQTVM